MKKAISSPALPTVPLFSQAIQFGPLLFTSGQIAATKSGDFKLEVTQVLDQLGQVLAAADLTYGDVLKVTVFITDIEKFSDLNEVYLQYFTGACKPARSCVEVSNLAMGAQVEIEFIAGKQTDCCK